MGWGFQLGCVVLQGSGTHRLEHQAGGQGAGNTHVMQAPGWMQEEGVEIEYVPAPLDLDLPGIKAETPAEDAPMPEAPGLGSVPEVKQEDEGAGVEVRGLALF